MRWPGPLLLLLLLMGGCTAPEGALERETSDEITKPSAEEVAWSSWSAEAGATNVTGPLFLPVQGTSPVRVRFVEPAFRGVDDASWTVPIAGNLVMGWGTSRADFRWTENESVILPLSPTLIEVVVNYKIRQVPEILLAQEYRAEFVLERSV